MKEQIFGKLPPQAIDVEKHLLGAILIDSRCLENIDVNLVPECFYTSEHQDIYSAIYKLHNEGKQIDTIIVCQEMKASGNKPNLHYISSLSDEVASTAHVAVWAAVVYEKYIKRRMIQKSHQTAAKCYDDTEDAFDIVSEDTNENLNIEQGINVADIRTSEDVASETVKDLFTSMQNFKKGIRGGIPTCSEEVNRLTGGFISGGVSIIAGMPGGGKTAYMLQCALEQCKAGYVVGIVSLEMKGALLTKRLISNLTKINGYKLRDGNLTEDEYQQAIRAAQFLSEKRLHITDDVYTDLNRLRAIIRKMKQKGCQIIYIDYLQLIKMQEGKKSTAEMNEEKTQTLQRYSREFDIPIVTLCQLKREGGKKPTMESLRGGGIEAAIDLILILWEEEPSDMPKSEIDLLNIIAKAKHGSTGDVKLHFDKSHQVFTDGHYGYVAAESVQAAAVVDDDGSIF